LFYRYSEIPAIVDLETSKLIKYYKVSQNDWIYCLLPVNINDLLVVIGSNLEYWTMSDIRNPIRSPIITNYGRKEEQRPFISSILLIDSTLVTTTFDGEVGIIDLEKRKTIHAYSEHKGRVWSVIQMSDRNIFASGADDKSIKIWDIRAKNSLQTLLENPGRVSALLKLSRNIFISGSCSDTLYWNDSQTQAIINIWDIRKLFFVVA